MTKLRPPLSIGAALARIAGQIEGDYSEMVRLTERSASLVRAWGDPERRERMPIDDAITLDLAYRRAGGQGAPIFEAYGTMLDAEGLHWFADQVALSRQAATIIRECSEAEVAVIVAAQPGATLRDRAQAAREIEEAMAVLARARTMLNGTAPFGAVGSAGSDQILRDPLTISPPPTRPPP